MDKFCTHALESLLRGSNWEAKFKEFYFNVCPRFKDFSTTSSLASYDDGGAFDVLMFEAYRNFITFFDLNIHIYLDQMGVSLTTLEESLVNNLREGDSSAVSLFIQFEMYGDFLKFSAIMKSKFQETFLNLESGKSTTDETLITKEVSLVEGSSLSYNDNPVYAENSPVGKLSKRCRAVRVLWDIENIPIMESLGGLETLVQLNKYVRTNQSVTLIT